MEYIISRKLTVEYGDKSTSTELRISLGDFKAGETCYSIVSCSPFFESVKIYGEDQLQALMLGLSFCSKQLKTTKERTVYWTDVEQAGLNDHFFNEP